MSQPILPKKHRNFSAHLTLWIGLLGILLGIAIGLLAGLKPALPIVLLVALGAVWCLFKDLEKTVLGLLILRTALDPFSAQQLPAAFAIGLDGLTILYVVVMLLMRQPIKTDRFWWFFASWTLVQGLWVILLPLGGLGMDGSFLATSMREWIRLFSWVLAYLLVMQLKDRTPPQKVINWLFWGLLIPLTVAALQLIAPSLLPPILIGASSEMISPVEDISRINGTFGVPATFTTFVILFILLTWWKLEHVRRRLPWLILLGLLVLFFVNTKSLFSLVMIAIAIIIMILPRLNITYILGGMVLCIIIIGLFSSSDFGQARLASVASTPLLNPDMDVSRAVLLSWTDNNSFNWRLAQWTFLLQAWQQYPVLGYGLLASPQLTVLTNYAHNEYIRALVEGGVVGLIAFLLLLGTMLGRLVQLFQKLPSISNQRSFCLTLIAMLVAMVFGMITENIWTHTTLFFYWWVLFAIADWDWQEPQNLASPSTKTSLSSVRLVS